MPTPRNQQISISDTPYYHCISRCVRRTFLCGVDNLTGKDYSHRKMWFSERLAVLSETFSIEICAYSVMENHFHSVLKINASLAQSWTNKEVIHRWQRLFNLPLLIERYLSGDCQSEAEQDRAIKIIQEFRNRLMDISWFMRCLNEFIARKANAEDKCTGRFWEGRYKSQALLNEQAVIACLAYVDLNPIRAGISDSLETSEFTSIKQRIEQIKSATHTTAVPVATTQTTTTQATTTQTTETPVIQLAPFIGSSQTKEGIAFSLTDYLELTDWTGRCVRDDKRGFISAETPKILAQLGLDEDCWMETVQSFSSEFHTFIGPEEQLQSICQKQKKKWLRGLNLCRKLFKQDRFCPIPI